jgi:hypothetical protein
MDGIISRSTGRASDDAGWRFDDDDAVDRRRACEVVSAHERVS